MSYLGTDVTLNPLLDAQSVWTDPRDAWIGEVFRTARVMAGFGDEIGVAPNFTDASVPTLMHLTDEYRFVSRIEQATEIFSRLVQNWSAI